MWELLSAVNLLMLMASLGFWLMARAKLDTARQLEIAHALTKMIKEDGLIEQIKKEAQKMARVVGQAIADLDQLARSFARAFRKGEN